MDDAVSKSQVRLSLFADGLQYCGVAMTGQDVRLYEPNGQIFEAMLVEISAYRSGGRHFAGLVSVLSAGLGSLIHLDTSLLASMREKWRILEEVNAIASDRGDFYPFEEHRALAATALQDLEELIKRNSFGSEQR